MREGGQVGPVVIKHFFFSMSYDFSFHVFFLKWKKLCLEWLW